MNILILDDDRRLRSELSTFLGHGGHACREAAALSEARNLLAGPERFDLILADLYLGAERGTELLRPRSGEDLPPLPPLIVISGAGGIREAVEALKAGAWDFLEKPVDPDRLLGLIRNLERGMAAERNANALREAWLAEHAASSPGSPFAKAVAEAARIAPSPLCVLIEGPSGSGKEVLARWIHLASPRSGGPFVAVNCAAVSSELAEAAFFGSRKGSFTGATADRPGWFQAAAGGTLFLDEVGETSLEIQAKLLRAVEYGEIQRVGSTETEKASLRLVCATNRDLRSSSAGGGFREDLYWRLAAARIRTPGLSERPDDVPILAGFFLARAREGFSFTEDSLAWLKDRSWPGNVRELKSFVERAAWLLPGPVIGKAELEGLQGLGERPAAKPALAASGSSAEGSVEPSLASPREEAEIRPLRQAKEAFEKTYLERALGLCGGSVSRAARALDLLPNNLSRKLKELGIRS